MKTPIITAYYKKQKKNYDELRRIQWQHVDLTAELPRKKHEKYESYMKRINIVKSLHRSCYEDCPNHPLIDY